MNTSYPLRVLVYVGNATTTNIELIICLLKSLAEKRGRKLSFSVIVSMTEATERLAHSDIAIINALGGDGYRLAQIAMTIELPTVITGRSMSTQNEFGFNPDLFKEIKNPNESLDEFSTAINHFFELIDEGKVSALCVPA